MQYSIIGKIMSIIGWSLAIVHVWCTDFLCFVSARMLITLYFIYWLVVTCCTIVVVATWLYFVVVYVIVYLYIDRHIILLLSSSQHVIGNL